MPIQGTASGGKGPPAEAGISTLPTISLPKGGGAIRGIGEKFGSNPATGTGSMTLPIATSPGRSSFQPQLSLSYDSGAGNGPFGFGWSLSLPAIIRKTDKGLPRYLDSADSDVFILSGAEDLVPVLEEENSSSITSEALETQKSRSKPPRKRPPIAQSPSDSLLILSARCGVNNAG